MSQGQWQPRFVCPQCHAAVTGRDGAYRCASCEGLFGEVARVYRFLAASRAAAAEPFHRQYRVVRERDGYRRHTPDYYRMLPWVPRTDPRAGEWRIRRESYAHLLKHGLGGAPSQASRVLELGAGNAWLSHRLAARGHHVVAVDRMDDEVDGLGACRHYRAPFMAVQADFDALPFEPGQFDLVVFDASLHYADDPLHTLRDANRMLARGGAVAVLDSPMFSSDRDGSMMVEDQLERMRAQWGLQEPLRAGAGYLTFDALKRAASEMGMQASFFPSRGSMRWRVGRSWSRVGLGRAPAAFGAWIAR